MAITRSTGSQRLPHKAKDLPPRLPRHQPAEVEFEKDASKANYPVVKGPLRI
jgi:hypothetical protein